MRKARNITVFLLITLSFGCMFGGMVGCNDRSHVVGDNNGESDGGTVTSDGGMSEEDMGGQSDAGETSDDDMPSAWTISISAAAPDAVRWTAGDVEDYLTLMGQDAEVVETTDVPTCEGGTGHVVFLGDGLGSVDASEMTDQTYVIAETRCEGGAIVELSGGGLLGRQYAGYQWTHKLGVRYFHPEEEFVPEEPRWPDEPLDVAHTPDFEYRSVSLHLTHPLELGDPLRLGEELYYDDVVRYIDWNVKNFASVGLDGVGDADLADYGIERGFARSSGFSLYNLQQGGGGVVDPDDPRPATEQIAEAVDEEMGDDPANYPEIFSFTFNPSEFSEVDDQVIVEQLTFLANYFEENYPETLLLTNNHGTDQEPTDFYGVRYFDLPKFAPSNLGVKVHTLMFYDLFRPAPVYGNENFNYLFDFMVEEYQTRPLWHFPEAAWWLTFDMAIPLYLPITIEARDMDIQNIAFMLDGKLNGHRAFGTGHEWGYWQNEYCSLRMPQDIDYRYTDCLADITDPMGDAAGEVRAVLEETIAMQERDFIYDIEALRYMVGSDPETELAAQVGIPFHPLPPLPEDIMAWDEEKARQWISGIEPRLKRMDREYHALLDRLNAVEDDVPTAPERDTSDRGDRPRVAGAAAFFREIRDGIEANALRAKHAHQVYGAVVRHRLAQITQDEQLAQEALSLLEAAEATTVDVGDVVTRREEDYRYSTVRSSAPINEDDTDENWTVYDYRYLNRVHHTYYYDRIDRLVREAIEGSGEPYTVDDVMPGPSQEINVEILAEDLMNPSVDFGDGTTPATGTVHTHTYGNAGIFTITISATRAGNDVEFTVDVASLMQRFFTGRTGKLVEPETDFASAIEGVMPALVVGPIDSTTFAMGTTEDETDGKVAPGDWSDFQLDTTSAALFETVAKETAIPLSVGSASASLTIRDAVIKLENAAGPLEMTGQLETQGIVDALVSLSGAFTEEDARATVADALGYTPDSLPETVPFLVEYQLQ